jgi:hypothetical protein
MSRIARSSLLLGVAVLSLAACSSTKGPGELGSKNDIVVRNNGLPQSKQQAAEAAPAAPAQQGGDFSSTVEQAEAIPMPEVATAEPLPDNSPAMEHAVKAQQEANAPLPSTATDEATNSAIPADPNTNPIDAVAPTAPVTESVAPPVTDEATTAEPAPAVISARPEAAPNPDTAHPATDYSAQAASQVPAPAAAPATPPTPGPSAVPAGVKYPLDPNAPFSPKAVAAATAAQEAIATTLAAAPATDAATAATTPAPIPTTANINDPAVVRAAQAALIAKGAYKGPETGEVDAAFLNALILYQGQNNLPQGGLNEATLKQLGVFQ